VSMVLMSSFSSFHQTLQQESPRLLADELSQQPGDYRDESAITDDPKCIELPDTDSKTLIKT